jgi:hypothetical protein
MTYEPGQQVLVRGEVFEHHEEDPPLFSVFLRGDQSHRHLTHVLAADVVGPAPATPADLEDEEVFARLAAAEARIAAALELLDTDYSSLGRSRIRRALSVVEAGEQR